MSNACENCKTSPVEIARNTDGTPTAKLIAVLIAHGVTSNAAIAEIVGISDRAVRKVRNHSSGTTVPTGTPGPELQDRSGTPGPKTELQDRNSSSALARAYKESPSEISITEDSLDSPLAPQAVVVPLQPRSRRGSRLDPDWQLPDDWMTWARVNCPAATVEQIQYQAAQFRDYWIAKPGAQACKLDWEATWRNWCRRGLSEAGMRRPQSTGSYRKTEPKVELDWDAINAYAARLA